MSIKYKFANPEDIYFVTFAVVGWIDVFTRNVYKDLLLDSFSILYKRKRAVYPWLCDYEQSCPSDHK